MRLLAILAVVATLVAAQGNAPTINTPPGSTANACQPLLVSWQGGSPPYYVDVMDGSKSVKALVVKEDKTSLTWNVDVPAGPEYHFQVRDSTGAPNASGKFTVVGDASACQSSSTTGGGGAGGAGSTDTNSQTNTDSNTSTNSDTNTSTGASSTGGAASPTPSSGGAASTTSSGGAVAPGSSTTSSSTSSGSASTTSQKPSGSSSAAATPSPTKGNGAGALKVASIPAAVVAAIAAYLI